MSDLVDQLSNEWYCYWDGSYGLPTDSETNYNFKPQLTVDEGGLVICPELPLNQYATDDSVSTAKRDLVTLHQV